MVEDSYVPVFTRKSLAHGQAVGRGPCIVGPVPQKESHGLSILGEDAAHQLEAGVMLPSDREENILSPDGDEINRVLLKAPTGSLRERTVSFRSLLPSRIDAHAPDLPSRFQAK